MRTNLLLLAFLLILHGTPVQSGVPNDKVVVPGVRVGKWTLTMTLDDLVRMNGYAVRILVMAGIPPAADAVYDHTIFGWDRGTPLQDGQGNRLSVYPSAGAQNIWQTDGGERAAAPGDANDL